MLEPTWPWSSGLKKKQKNESASENSPSGGLELRSRQTSRRTGFVPDTFLAKALPWTCGGHRQVVNPSGDPDLSQLSVLAEFLFSRFQRMLSESKVSSVCDQRYQCSLRTILFLRKRVQDMCRFCVGPRLGCKMPPVLARGWCCIAVAGQLGGSVSSARADKND